MSSSLTTPLLWNFISSSASFGVTREASLQLEVSILLWFAWELAALPLISHKLFPIISYVHATCMHDHYGTCMATFGHPIFQAHNYMEIFVNGKKDLYIKNMHIIVTWMRKR